MSRNILLLLLLPALTLSSVAQTSARTTASGHPLEISSGDLLDLNFFDTPELSTKARVDERGHVTLPLGGELSLAGMTAARAGEAIEVHFRQSDILKDPHVAVTVLEYATQGVTVLGEVRNPGIYPLLGPHSLLDLISAAGGLTPNAGKAVTITHRANPEHPEVVSLDSKASVNADLNPDIEPRDTIMVAHAGVVYVVGDVGKPGGFLIETNDHLTVLQAIALAQGTNKTAALNRARLIRKTSTERLELPMPLKKILSSQAEDPMLLDGDILFVPSSQEKNFAYRSMEAAIQMATGVVMYGRY
ncbi:MAG TPA: polysaccharide biosynthesis/export family protein [Terriglobales bacterium]|jgi:polysaccharide export outer membrane protein|nr:polysaccharide biosynthesis/export family protein [Terriglobales bacterium]